MIFRGMTCSGSSGLWFVRSLRAWASSISITMLLRPGMPLWMQPLDLARGQPRWQQRRPMPEISLREKLLIGLPRPIEADDCTSPPTFTVRCILSVVTVKPSRASTEYSRRSQTRCHMVYIVPKGCAVRTHHSRILFYCIMLFEPATTHKLEACAVVQLARPRVTPFVSPIWRRETKLHLHRVDCASH